MKTYVTAEQHDRLCERLGGSIGGGLALAQIGVECRQTDRKDQLDFQDVRSMAAELGEYIALRFSTKDDVLDRFPWLCPEDAQEVAYRTAKHFDYEFIGERLEATMTHVGHPIDPPAGWFEWENEHGDTVWATWTEEDTAAATENGWRLAGLPTTPRIEADSIPEQIYACDQAAMDLVQVSSELWPAGKRKSLNRAASKAVAAIAWAKEINRPDVVLDDGTQQEMKLAHEVGKGPKEAS